MNPTKPKPATKAKTKAKPTTTGARQGEQGRFLSVRDIIVLDLINERGVWRWDRFHAINAALPPIVSPGEWLRPHASAAVPASRPRF
jgi:hypothetical protein